MMGPQSVLYGPHIDGGFNKQNHRYFSSCRMALYLRLLFLQQRKQQHLLRSSEQLPQHTLSDFLLQLIFFHCLGEFCHEDFDVFSRIRIVYG